MAKQSRDSSKNKSMVEKVERRTLYYEYIQSMTQIVIAFSIFIGLLVSIFPLIEEGHNILGVKLEFVVIFLFVAILSVLLYLTHRKLIK